MKTLLHFTPAELLVLRHGRQAPVRHMLRLTFADLLLRNVLRVEYRDFQPSPHDPPVAYAYVRPGEAHADFRPRPHERPLLDILPLNRQMGLLRQYVAVLLEQLGPATLRQLAADSLEQAGYVRRTRWHRLWNSFDWSFEGSVVRVSLQQETEELTRQINRGLVDPTELRAQLHGTALLLGGPLPAELREFDQELLRQLRRRHQQLHSGPHWGPAPGTAAADGDAAGPDFGGGHSGGGGASGDFGDGDSAGGCSGCSGCGGGCGGD